MTVAPRSGGMAFFFLASASSSTAAVAAFSTARTTASRGCGSPSVARRFLATPSPLLLRRAPLSSTAGGRGRGSPPISATTNGEAESSSSPAMATTTTMTSTASDYSGLSRVPTLQALLTLRGAPGSVGCTGGNDLSPILPADLVPAAANDDDVPSSSPFADLHPHLLPLARSATTGNLVCALRRPFATDVSEYDRTDSVDKPCWPIVESATDQPGMRLLSLNSEHLMRRIVAEADDGGGDDAEDAAKVYNEGLGAGSALDGAFADLDDPYEAGSVADLGYGSEKYVLLRVGPFPDLYDAMSKQHLGKGDERSALIAAEASNGKFVGFGSTFAHYARLLKSLPMRGEEARDAARVCLRVPLPSMGLTREDFAEVARTAELGADGGSDCDAGADTESALAGMLAYYEKIRDHEREDNAGDDKTPQQAATEEANYILDTACLTGRRYGEVRDEIAGIYRGAGMDDAADFVLAFR